MTSEVRAAGAPVRGADVLRDGLFAGLIGAFTVIAVFFAHDAASESVLWTPTVLGTLLFQGPEAALHVRQPVLSVALAYNGIHVLMWLAAGVGASWIAHLVEAHPRLWYVAGLAVIFVALVFLGLDRAAEGVELPRLHLWIGGLLGAAAMGAFLVWRHPRIVRRAGTIWEE